MAFRIVARKHTGKLAPMNESYRYIPFGIIDINSNLLWAEGYTGVGVKIAVIDCGIFNHVDLGGRIAYRKDFSGTNSITESHGTHVAGTIGAGGKLYGVAPACTFYDLQIIGQNGGSMDSFAAAVREAIRLDVDIINMSIGTTSKDLAIEAVIKQAYQKGILLISAAGNDGPGSTLYPGAYSECISVANLNIVNDTIDKTSSANPEVFCCAPGDNVYSLAIDNKFMVMSGTSMATPHVSGIAALFLQKSRKLNSNFTKQQHRDNVMKMIKENLFDIGPVGYDIESGYGEVRYKPNIKPSISFLEKSVYYYITT